MPEGAQLPIERNSNYKSLDGQPFPPLVSVAVLGLVRAGQSLPFVPDGWAERRRQAWILPLAQRERERGREGDRDRETDRQTDREFLDFNVLSTAPGHFKTRERELVN